VAKLGELDAFKKGIDAKAAAIPESADKYAVELPKDFKLPDGWSIKTDDPLWKTGREFAKANGLTQEQFSGLARIYVEGQIAEKTKSDGALKAELDAFDKALPNASARRAALDGWFTSTFGAKIGDQLAASLFTPDIVAAWEQVRRDLTKGATNSSPAAAGRVEGRTDGRPEGWERMSAVDRRTWNLTQQMVQRRA
jgi:hypothetical protein